MALTDAKVKTAKVSQGKKQQKFADGGGLFLLVNKSGKYWRLKYRLHGKEKLLSIGIYPQVSLKQARSAREQAKEQLRAGIDPMQAKQAAKRQQVAKAEAVTFEGVTLEWLSKKRGAWSDHTYKGNASKLTNHVLPWLGSLPIQEIKAIDVLSVARRVEERGHIELAHRVKNICSQVMRYGVATCRVDSDPTRDLQGALAPKQAKHRACIKKPKEAGELMRAIQGFTGTHIVKCALMLSPYVMLRPTEIRNLLWEYIDFDAATISIPAENMKMKRPHIVPLSSQAIAILKDIQPLTGDKPYVFHSVRNYHRPISENTINVSLKRLGYCTTTQHCAHGFRGMASTLLYSQGFKRDVVERQLAHEERNQSVAAYNHFDFLPERKAMLQHYADYLDGLRDGASVVPIHRAKA